jgi:hypothetical protein
MMSTSQVVIWAALRRGAVLLTVAYCYQIAAEQVVRLPLGQCELIVHPAQIVLVVASVVAVLGRLRAPTAFPRLTLVSVVVYQSAFMLALALALAIVLSRHYLIHKAALLFGVALKGVEIGLVLLVSLHVLPTLAQNRITLRIVGMTNAAVALECGLQKWF